jgi:hypothetical protein
MVFLSCRSIQHYSLYWHNLELSDCVKFTNMNRQDLLLFGDQTAETLESIQNLVRQSKKLPSLQKFLRDATDVVQLQSSKLAAAERQRFFAFDTILDLAEKQAEQSNSDDLLATVLSYISRLGELIM